MFIAAARESGQLPQPSSPTSLTGAALLLDIDYLDLASLTHTYTKMSRWQISRSPSENNGAPQKGISASLSKQGTLRRVSFWPRVTTPRSFLDHQYDDGVYVSEAILEDKERSGGRRRRRRKEQG